ncbi:MAG: signal recognition particle receptor subunit alpha [Candidatus Micrarchaeaceae archaeon]
MDLGEGLRQALAKITRATIIDASTIREFNKELQKALLSADVDVELVFNFTKRIEEAALKSKIPEGVAPTDYITNLVYDELVKLMGDEYKPELKPKKILLAGLYGSGKTTTAAKLAKYYQDRGLSAVLICTDTTRPAAYEQLETLAKQANVSFFGIKGEKNAAKIIEEGMKLYKNRKVIICDTSGRSALNQELVEELKKVSSAFKPDEKILVIGADIGHIAGVQATEFNNAIGLSGVIITRMDGSGKGGGALSAANASGIKAMFIGTGEKIRDLEIYNPAKFIGRLLGMPDIAGLAETVKQAIKDANVDITEEDEMELTFDTFYKQLKVMANAGPMQNLMNMMGAGSIPKDLIEESEGKLKRYKTIIDSMTKEERKNEKLLHDSSRIKRIAKGSGMDEKDIRQMIGDFNKMKRVFNMLKNDRSFIKKFSKLKN